MALYDPVFGNFGYDGAITNGGNYALQIAATQNILNKNILKPQFGTVALQGKSLENTGKLNEHDLKHNVITQYLSVWADQKQLENTRQTIALMKQESGIIKPLVQSGMMKQTGYLSFNMELQSAALNEKQLLIQYNIDLMTLNIMCGLQDSSTSVKIEAPGLEKKQVRYNYYNTPSFLQYHIDSLILVNQKQLIDVRYKPRLNWMADAGFLSSTPAFYTHPGFSLGLAFTMPVFDGKQRQIDYRKLEFQERTRLNYVSYNKNQYDLQFVALNNQLNASYELVKNIEAQLKNSESLIEMSKRELNTGDLSVTDFIMILRNNIDLRNNLNQNEVKIWQIINDINYWNWGE
jgi:outer membrane protein TolC